LQNGVCDEAITPHLASYFIDKRVAAGERSVSTETSDIDVNLQIAPVIGSLPAASATGSDSQTRK